MFNELVHALRQALEFRDIDPGSITRIDHTVGFVWFKAGEQTYLLDLQKAEFDLDEYASQ